MYELDMYVVYDHAADFPGKVVVRRWVIGASGEPRAEKTPTAIADSLDEARRAIPPGRYRQAPHPNDDLAIAEVWL